MKIIGCGKGHYYNPDLYSVCPECAKEHANAAAGVTEAVNFARYSGGISDIGATEPVNFEKYASMGYDVGVTEPVKNGNSFADVGVTEPVRYGQDDVLNTGFFRENAPVENFGRTMPVSPFCGNEGASFTGSIPFMPVVGWLVCIEGPAKGRDYKIHSQYNYIGRGRHMDICISGDDCISTERAAVIAYDADEKFFSFGPSMGHNVVRVNGKMLMNAVVLNAYDELTIGKTKLLFVPLCGERFDWNDK